MGTVTDRLPSSPYPHCADPLLAPYNWCSEQWTYLGSTIEAQQSCMGEVIKRMALFVPLALASFVAVLGFALHAAITACYPPEFPSEPTLPPLPEQVSQLATAAELPANPEVPPAKPTLPAPLPPLPERVSQVATVVLPPHNPVAASSQAPLPGPIQTAPITAPPVTETFFGVTIIYENGKKPTSPTFSLTANRELLIDGKCVLTDTSFQYGMLKISPGTTSLTVYDKASLPFTHPYVKDNRCVIRQIPAPDQSEETEWNVSSFEYVCIRPDHKPLLSPHVICSATPIASRLLDPQDVRAKGVRLMQNRPNLRFDTLAYSPQAKIAIASATDLSSQERLLYLTSANHAEFLLIPVTSQTHHKHYLFRKGPFSYTADNGSHPLCSLLAMPPLWEENFSAMDTDHIQECRDVQYIGLRGPVRELNGGSDLQPKTLQFPTEQITVTDETNDYVYLECLAEPMNGVQDLTVNGESIQFLNGHVRVMDFLDILQSPHTLLFRPLTTPGVIEVRITRTISDGESSSKSVYFDLANRHGMGPQAGKAMAYSYPPHPLTAEQAQTKCIPFLTGTPFSIKQAVFSPRTGLIAILGHEPETTKQTVYYSHGGMSEFQRFEKEYEATKTALTDKKSVIALMTNCRDAASQISLDGMPGIALDGHAIYTQIRTHLDQTLNVPLPVPELRSLVTSYTMQTRLVQPKAQEKDKN